MDFSLIIKSLPIYLDGLWTTVWLVGLALIIGLSVAIPLAVARNSHNFFISGPSWAFIYFMMDNQQRKGMLAKTIKSEQVNLCYINGLEQVEKVMGMPIKGLQKQFNNWAKLKLREQNI